MIDTDTEEVHPGSLLAVNVHAVNGPLLLEAGTRLTAKHLRMLKAHGIERINIVQMTPAEANEIPPAAPAQPHLLELFRHTNTDHPFIRTLMRLSELRVGHSGAGSCQHDH
ncbi:MAG: hypothetical protein IDH49_00125 [Gammaproteobacteria bacterium]|nr:hypothetical protein [Gammaproteobacteria bacterium]